jgi:hypothetical protein
MNALNAIRGDDIQAKGFLISTAEALRAFLRDRPEVVSLRRAINTGEITSVDIKIYVEELLRSFRAGRKFTDEIALAAIAIAVETFPGAFAEEYLENLANLRIQELPLATRVARLSLSRRREVVIGVTDRLKVISALPQNQGIQPREVEPFWVDARHNADHLLLKDAS